MVPTAYSFPSAGTLLGLGFIMFSAWYVGSPISVADYASYVGVGAFVAFGSMAVAIPFMLDFFSLPADMFQLIPAGQRRYRPLCNRTGRHARYRHFAAGCICRHGKLRWQTLFQIVLVSIVIAGVFAVSLGICAYPGHQL